MNEGLAKASTAHDYRVCVVVINYCTPDLVVGALESLATEIDPSRDCAVVVDNASPDDSLTSLRRLVARSDLCDWCRLTEAPENGGFSYGNNVGMRAVDAEFYLLLNSDAYLRPGALDELLSAARQHTDAGIISPRLEWPDGEGQISCFRFHSPMSELIDAAETGPITKLLARFDVPLSLTDAPSWPDWTSFACILLRASVRERIGEMDEGYFLYYEDVDYCRSAQRHGLKVLNWPAAHVVHLRGGSSEVKRSQAKKKRLPKYFYRSRSRYFTKFYSPLGFIGSNLCFSFGFAVAWLRQRIGGKATHLAEAAGRDVWTWPRPHRTSGQGVGQGDES